MPTLCIVGVGLIGGSIALASKRRGGADIRIVGVCLDQPTLDQARQVGAIDEGFLDLERAVQQADVIVFATPVDCIVDLVARAAAHCRPSALLMDVASTKAAIVGGVAGRSPSARFIGAHPLAGSEQQGVAHADAHLFEGRQVILTPTAHTAPEIVAQAQEFWCGLGASTLMLNAAEHDRAMAFTSHLPHLVAAALAANLPWELLPLTASGFRDTTRIAAGDPALWAGILLQNASPVLAALDQLEGRLAEFRNALQTADADGLRALLRRAKEVPDRTEARPDH